MRSTDTKNTNLIHEGIIKLGVCNCSELEKLILEGLMLSLGSISHHLCDSQTGPHLLRYLFIILSKSFIRGLRNLLLQTNERHTSKSLLEMCKALLIKAKKSLTQKRKDMKTSVVKLYQVFPSYRFTSHLRYSSGVSMSLKLSSGWLPNAFTRWSVCTILVLTWECSMDLQSQYMGQHKINFKSIDESIRSLKNGEGGLTC